MNSATRKPGRPQIASVGLTEAKAKAVKPYAEKMITLGKRGDLHARRLALAELLYREERYREKLATPDVTALALSRHPETAGSAAAAFGTTFGASFSRRRASTTSGTRPAIGPPRAKTSLISRELT